MRADTYPVVSSGEAARQSRVVLGQSGRQTGGPVLSDRRIYNPPLKSFVINMSHLISLCSRLNRDIHKHKCRRLLLFTLTHVLC